MQSWFLNYCYGVKGIANNWFQSFLTNRKQFTIVNDYNSRYQQITHCVPQGSVLVPLLFILFINELHLSVNDSKVHHVADDTNLLFSNTSLKKINSCINHDLALLIQLLKANKINLNLTKSEIGIFRPKQKSRTKHMNLRISGQRAHLSSKVRYQGVILQENLEWEQHPNTQN